LKILLIEDDNKIIDSLRLLIKTFDKDAQILCADSGKTAVKILDREPLNLVILDLGLPDISGMSVLKTIKQRIPVPARISIRAVANSAAERSVSS